MNTGRTKRDKIFDNTFEDQEFELDSNLSFDIAPAYSDDRDEEDKIEQDIIMDKIHDMVSNSRFKKFNKIDEFNQTLKLKKIDINDVYDFMNDELCKDHSMIVVFSVLCDYFNVNPTKFYSSLGNKFKEDLITELDKATGVLGKRNINRLF
jgi:hypothetical protein|tara:strand:+ start:932 stop:1384 length:453 start_codon:yes stop_codon:yes gene_type:complete